MDLNGSGGGEVGIGDFVPTPLQCATPASLGDALLDDPKDDDMDLDIIADDNGDDIGPSELEGVHGEPAGFGARDTEGSAGLTEFQVGQQFQDKDEAVLNVKTYSIRRRVQYKVVESDYRRYVGKCYEFGNGCTWLIRLSLQQRKGIWEVKRPIYMRVWLAKQKAVVHIYGDWDESYNDLPRWVLGVQLTMPGTVAVLRTSPVRVGGQVDDSQAYFHRLFLTFPPSVEVFRHCKPLVSIDGTHLYGKYGRMLLVAIAQDGNSNILPIAFALFEGENAESWSFFLSHLRQHMTLPGLLVISDRHNGIKAVLEAPDGGWLPPAAYCAFCIRHVAVNFALTCKGKDARRLLVNAAYAKTEVEFDYWFDILRSEDPAMCEWANRIEYSLWTQHRDEGRRFGHMTTNISECVNSILKGVRNLSVCSLVKATYGRLAELFVRKGREAEAQLGTGQQFSQHLVQCIEANLKKAKYFTLTLYDRDNSEFTVAETTPIGSFSLGTYRVYRLSSVFSVYRMGFTPPIPEGFWPPYDGPTEIPDSNKRRASEGHPRSTRIWTTMDETDPNMPKRCGLCRQPGHTRRSCPQVGGPSLSGRHD
ncbi:uncharacterized protein [Arachis hypogaea]|uniref:uncharacterized protein n=1 Tax=Arachis hypogaea TaxID=3818 RepID=UPI000DEC7827|nr:uncharacterized protein LOC112803956 [Arachis hypogaea]